MRHRPGDGLTHPAACLFARDYGQGLMSRREFLTRATALGVGAGAAYGLIGAPSAQAQEAAPDSPAALPAPIAGGTLRMSMELRPPVDPRSAAWPQVANVTRGWLEYLVEYQNDGTIRGMLLERWEANADATGYVLHLRPGITWSNGDALVADHLIWNLARWCDGTAAGNSMAARCQGLVDPATGQLRAGAAVAEDALTLRLTLTQPDCALIATFADYPAAVLHPSYDGGDPLASPGTGPYRCTLIEPGSRAVLERVRDRPWWGTAIHGGPWLDRIEYIDLGSDPGAELRAAKAALIDATYQSVGDYIPMLDGIGWRRSETPSAATLAVRFRQDTAPFDSLELRRGLTLCVDNAVVLELGHADHGQIAENHHVCPLHPEYFALPSQVPDPKEGAALVRAAGFGDQEFELVSLDDAWQAASCDAVAAQIQDAGLKIRRRVVPGAVFWQEWKDYPFSATEWNMRPLGVQVLAVAYRSGAAWNESGFSDAEFDALLAEALAITDAARRSQVMKRLEQILQDNAVMIQPYWRNLCRHTTPLVQNCAQHALFEHHHYEWWMRPAPAEPAAP